jgi:anthranilate phosphoribosyltransferase
MLEAMGIAAAKEPKAVEQDIEQKGFGHLHAARYLHGVERLKPHRQIMYYRSFLHACEVVLNPARATRSLVGAAHEHFLERFATVAGERDQEHVLAVQGLDGGDELPLAPTAVAEYRDGNIESYTLSPTDFGLREKGHYPCEETSEAISGVIATLAGEDDTHLDAILFNAGVRIYLGGVAKSVEDGITLAREAIACGNALKKLIELKE